jgi:DNA modification methylase
VFTDPPYGINLDGDYTGRGGRNLANFKDDSTQYAIKAFDLVQDMGVAIQVWFGANYYCHHLPETNNWLIWDKRGADGVENTNSDAELAWVKDGHDSCRVFRHLWMGMVKASEHGEKRIHPTQKPIKLWSYCFERYAPDATICLDLFGGSGSTMMACEQLNRKCRMMELDPHYCDVIIARWEKLTGQKAVKL